MMNLFLKKKKSEKKSKKSKSNKKQNVNQEISNSNNEDEVLSEKEKEIEEITEIEYENGSQSSNDEYTHKNSERKKRKKSSTATLDEKIKSIKKQKIKKEVITNKLDNVTKANSQQNDSNKSNKKIIIKREETVIENNNIISEDEDKDEYKDENKYRNEFGFIEDGFEEIDFEEVEFEESIKKEDIKKNNSSSYLLYNNINENKNENKYENSFMKKENSEDKLNNINNEISISNDDNDFVTDSQFEDLDSNIDENNLNIEIEIKEDKDNEETNINSSKENNNNNNKEVELKIINEFKLMNTLVVKDNLSEESDDDDNDEEWENVEISTLKTINDKEKDINNHELSSSDNLLLSNQSITITFGKDEIKKKKNKGINKFDRIVRELTHKVNLLCLLSACKIWNTWSNVYEIKCICLSLLPLDILKIVKNNINLKLDDFYSSLKQFCEWFRSYTNLDKNNNMEDSNKLKLKSKSKSRKNSRLRKKSNNNNEEVVVEEKKEKKKGKKNNKSRKTSDDDDDDDEVKEKKKKLNNKNKNKNKEIDETDETNKTDENDEENETEEDSDKNKFLIKRYKDLEFLLGNPIFIERFVNTRNLYIILFVALARTAGYRCNFVASLHPIPLSFAKKKTNNHEAIELWTEIYCKRAKRWVPVNPLNKHSVYPIPKQLITNEFNEISYIITIDKDGFIKERTKRYARDFLTFTRKLRLKNDAKWWEVNVIKRYFTTNVIDDFDEEIPDETEEKQPLPTSISGFLNHPLYVLERHIKKYEVLYSKEPVLGYIRNEAIYPRSNVRPVNTKEYWIRQGLSIKEGAKAPKYVKSKVYTIRKKRMIEFSKQNAVLDKDFKLGDEMVPLYGDWQTEPYKAPPVKNGIVPKSQFGNIDMFKPSMLPEGGTHLQIQGLGPLARKLNIDFANAVVGFDFKLGHCVPIIDGIVVATENVDLLLSKFEEFELEKFKKFMKKKEKRIMSNWRRLVKGLISRERLIEKYGNEK